MPCWPSFSAIYKITRLAVELNFFHSCKIPPQRPWPTLSREGPCIGSGESIESTRPEGHTAYHTLVVIFVLGGYVQRRQGFCTWSHVENPWGGSFLFPPEPLLVKLLTAPLWWRTQNTISKNYFYLPPKMGVLRHKKDPLLTSSSSTPQLVVKSWGGTIGIGAEEISYISSCLCWERPPSCGRLISSETELKKKLAHTYMRHFAVRLFKRKF